MPRLATRQQPQTGGHADPLLRARRPRPADFRRWLFVHPEADPHWCRAEDAALGESYRWYRDTAGAEMGRLISQWGYSVVCWSAWPVLDRFGVAMGGITAGGADAAAANHFRFRFYPQKLDVYARPSERPGDFCDFWARQVAISAAGAIYFNTLVGRPVFELRPVAAALWGLEGAALEAKAPHSLAELHALADELLAAHRHNFGPDETLATLFNQIGGTASTIKQIYRRIGLRAQTPHKDYQQARKAAAARQADLAALPLDSDPADVDRALRAYALADTRRADLGVHLASRTFHGWPIEQAMVGALMHVGQAGRLLRDYAMLDYRSMYCLAAADSRLWELQKAAYIESHELSEAALDRLRTWIKTLDPEALSPASHSGRGIWRNLNVFCKVALRPGDRLVLALIEDQSNQVESRWSEVAEVPGGGDVIKVICLADVILSYFFTGRLMDIRGALKIWPSRERQRLKPIQLFGATTYDFSRLDPYAVLPAHKEQATDPATRRALKQICVAAYGITGEAHSPRHINYGRPQDRTPPAGPDRPGTFYCPAVAALTTAAARLRLGAQICRADAFGPAGVAACHTDSLIVPRRLVDRLLSWERPGDLRPVKGNISGAPLVGHSFLVWGIGRHAAWSIQRRADGSSELDVANGSRAGMNDPELDVDSPAAWQKMLRGVIIQTATHVAPDSIEAGLIHHLPSEVDSFWRLPTAISFRAKPDKLWRLWPYLPGLEAMDALCLTITNQAAGATYITRVQQWPAIRTGCPDRLLAVRPAAGDGMLLELESFDATACASYGDLARLLAQPDAPRPERVRLTSNGIEALARRDFEFGVAKSEELGAIMASMRYEAVPPAAPVKPPSGAVARPPAARPQFSPCPAARPLRPVQPPAVPPAQWLQPAARRTQPGPVVRPAKPMTPAERIPMLPSPSLRLPLAAKDDPKMLALSDHEFRLWIGLLSLAGQADPVGTIPAFPLRGLAAALHTTPDDLTAALTTLTQLGMVTQLPGGAIEISEFAAQYDMAAVVVPPAPSRKARQPRPRRSAVLTLRQAQAFETLWTNHPRRRGSRGEKRAAEIEFAEIPESEWPALALAQRNYILVCSGPNGRYPKDACRWLRDDYWRDYIEIAPLTVLQGGRANEADRITNRVGAIAARVAAGRMAQSL